MSKLQDASNKELLESHRLRLATELAVKHRREELDVEETTLTAHLKGQYGNKETEWKTCAELTTAQLERLSEIRKEKQIINSLMIKTQQYFTKLGGKVKVEIRHSDEPDKVQRVYEQ